MAIAIDEVLAVHDTGQHYRAIVTLTLSSSYSSGGESLASLWNNAQLHTSHAAIAMHVEDTSGFVFRYDKANNKLIIFGQEPTNATSGVFALSQLAATTYPSTLTTDVITADVMFQKG